MVYESVCKTSKRPALQEFFSLIVDQKIFDPRFDKLINGLLYFRPVTAMLFDHHTVDGKAAVHLEIENSFGLFKSQKAVLH